MEAKEALNYRLAMEDLFIKISNRFVNISAEDSDFRRRCKEENPWNRKRKKLKLR